MPGTSESSPSIFEMIRASARRSPESSRSTSSFSLTYPTLYTSCMFTTGRARVRYATFSRKISGNHNQFVMLSAGKGVAELPAAKRPGRGPPRRTLSRVGRSKSLTLQQERLRVLDKLFYADEELHGVGAVHDTVVVGEGEVHHGPDLYLAVHDHRPLLDLVHPQDSHLRYVQDRCRVQGPEDAAVGYGERAALKLLDAQGALARLLA